MRYRLRTLMIVLALGPPLLAGLWMALHDSAALATLTLFSVFVAGGVVLVDHALWLIRERRR